MLGDMPSGGSYPPTGHWAGWAAGQHRAACIRCPNCQRVRGVCLREDGIGSWAVALVQRTLKGGEEQL